MTNLTTKDLSTITESLRLIKNTCNSRGSGESCAKCPFSVNSLGCMFKGIPGSWNLHYIGSNDSVE